MNQYLLVAMGGALGALARYQVGLQLRLHVVHNWPLATLSVNVLGSLGIGVVFVLLERGIIHTDFRSLVVIGFFGAFTTFSTFSLELLHLIERGAAQSATSYAIASLLCCLVGVTIGVWSARTLL
jgi:CrcB protein